MRRRPGAAAQRYDVRGDGPVRRVITDLPDLCYTNITYGSLHTPTTRRTRRSGKTFPSAGELLDRTVPPREEYVAAIESSSTRSGGHLERVEAHGA